MELRRKGRHLNLCVSNLSTSVARRAKRAVMNWVKWRISSVKVEAVEEASSYSQEWSWTGENKRYAERVNSLQSNGEGAAAHLLHTTHISEEIKYEVSVKGIFTFSVKQRINNGLIYLD